MKANEAPEKIYVVDATFPDHVDFDGSPINTKRIDDHDIEYIRKDVIKNFGSRCKNLSFLFFSPPQTTLNALYLYS